MPTRHTRSDGSRAPQARAAVSALAVLGLFALAACSNDHTTGVAEPNSPLVPLVTGYAVQANPLNSLSTIVTFTATNADSARVLYSTPGDTAAATPFVALTGDSGRIATLGLLPNATYSNTLEVYGAHGRTAEPFQFATGPLSPYVQTAVLNISGSFGPGYTLVSPILYTGDSVLMVIFDSKGRVRWYREFPPGTGSVESKQQKNGHFTLAIGGSQGDDNVPETYDEILPTGEVIANYAPPAGEQMDSHELIETGTVNAPILHFFGYTSRPFDFSALGGPANGTGMGHQLIREFPAGSVQFLWDAWDHYTIQDWIEPTGVDPPDDFDHANSLAFDLDSNYVVSFRHMGAIVKLNYQTGARMWQLGGRQTQFTILKDPLGFFSGQHSVRVLDNGNILLYDNGLRHTPPHTRAAEYTLDLTKMTATLVWEYEPNPVIFTDAVGSVQRLKSGNTLVGFGLAGQIHEVNAQGKLVGIGIYSLHNRGAFYRAIRLVSLYQYLEP
jgi:arylsulfate sulfotransferase